MSKDLIANLALILINGKEGEETDYQKGALTLAAFTLYPDEDSLAEAIELVLEDVEGHWAKLDSERAYQDDYRTG